MGRRIAFEPHGLMVGLGGLLDGGDQRSIILCILQRRQKHAQVAVAGLDSERRSHRANDVVGGIGPARWRLQRHRAALRLERLAVRQPGALGEWIGRLDARIVDRRDEGKRAER